MNSTRNISIRYLIYSDCGHEMFSILKRWQIKKLLKNNNCNNGLKIAQIGHNGSNKLKRPQEWAHGQKGLSKIIYQIIPNFN